MAKLTAEEVAAIRSLHQPGSRVRGARALARRFGVAAPTILDIVRGRTWKQFGSTARTQSVRRFTLGRSLPYTVASETR